MVVGFQGVLKELCLSLFSLFWPILYELKHWLSPSFRGIATCSNERMQRQTSFHMSHSSFFSLFLELLCKSICMPHGCLDVGFYLP
jgi:hypothetical protein